MAEAPALCEPPFKQGRGRRSSAGPRRAARAALLISVALGACVRERPAYYRPLWSADGNRITYVVEGPDGRMALRSIDLATRQAGELATGRFASPPVAIAPGPDGKSVACAFFTPEKGRPGSLSLHVLARDSTGAARSTDRVLWQQASPRGLIDLAWAPDGRSIVVAADRPGGSALWHLPVPTGKPRLLSGDFGALRAPAVSPDGQRAAFVARRRAGVPWSLYVISLSGGEQTEVAPALFRRYRVGYEPAWSPKGGRLAYVTERYLTAGTAEVWLWDAATGQRRRLALAPSGACIAPTWSPDGQRVAYVRLPFGIGPAGPGSGGRPADILAVDLASRKPRVLVADGLANLMPAWSPDGRTIAFNTCADPAAGPHVVRLVGLEGEPPRPAHDSPGARFLLAWARHERGQRAALREARASLDQLQEPSMRAYAHVAIAGHHEGRGDWPSVARYAGIAAESAAAPRLRGLRLAARRLLVEAQMRLGQPKAALATAEQLRSATQAESERRLHERLQRGLRAVEEAERARRTKPAPDALHQLAEAHLSDLGNPRQALEYCFRILSDFGQYPRLPDVAAILFGCYEKLGVDATSHRLLERAAKNLGPGSPSPRQALLLAEAAAASGQPEMAIRWLRRLPRGVDLDRGAAGRATAVYLRAAEHFQASGASEKALAAWRRAAALRVPPLAARAAVLAGEVLAKAGRHGDAARHLLAALAPQADPETMRRARRALAVGRLRRLDPVAYDAAHVGQLAVFGFLGRAVALGEQTLGGLPMDDARRELGRHVADAFDGLVAYHLAAGDVERATGAVGRWLRLASPKDDLPRALAHLAACQELAGQHRARIETLSRLAIEFADRPEGAEARRELRLLNAPARP